MAAAPPQKWVLCRFGGNCMSNCQQKIDNAGAQKAINPAASLAKPRNHKPGPVGLGLFMSHGREIQGAQRCLFHLQL